MGARIVQQVLTWSLHQHNAKIVQLIAHLASLTLHNLPLIAINAGLVQYWTLISKDAS